MPKGYLVGELEVTNPAGYQQYSSKVPAIIAQYGGRYLVRGGEAKLLEGGSGSAGRNVVVEFDSPEQLMKFYNSSEYQAILPHRLNNSTGRVKCVAGFEG
ncbi:MAG: DUF1330 domain-containing protein [Acetobacteraceae bacterium]|nr:DUF1330 domain-containing protein [Acetobacteraceae bacterium]MSP29143.1 DUF1330 domain-containing protein [Acetobacteraceae bacterium]